jgi:hypothetical protein
MQLWLDADGNRGRGADGVPTSPRRACLGRYDELRPVRAETDGVSPHRASDGAPDLSFGAERDAIHVLYGAKIEATRRSLPGRDIAAAVRAILDDQRAALWAVTVRQILAKTAWRERRANDRHAGIVAQQNARAPPESRL